MADETPPAGSSSEPAPDPHTAPSAQSPHSGDTEIPWGQRFFDRPFLLLFLGLVIMAVFFTGWGLWEINSLPPAPLP